MIDSSGKDVTSAKAITPMELSEMPVMSAMSPALIAREGPAINMTAAEIANTPHAHFRVRVEDVVIVS